MTSGTAKPRTKSPRLPLAGRRRAGLAVGGVENGLGAVRNGCLGWRSRRGPDASGHLSPDWLNKQEDGKFTALMLALALEDYASECTEPIFVLSNFVSSHHSTEEPSGSVPSLPVFAEKTNWRSIGVDHASSVLGFRVKVGTAHSALRDTWQFEGPASTWGSAADTAVELGAAALQIAGQLRAAFKLGPADRQEGFDPQTFFSDRLADLKTRRAQFAKAVAEKTGELQAAASKNAGKSSKT